MAMVKNEDFLFIGIGFETTKFLLANGATVVMGCRNAVRGEASRRQIIEDVQNSLLASGVASTETPAILEARLLLRSIDLASLRSVRAFVESLEREGTLKRLDLLILNAAQTGQKEREETEDGLEVTIATNHFGHFLLANLLLPHLKRTAEAALANGTPVPRIVCVSSKGHAGIPLFYKPVLDIDEKGDDLNLRKPGAYTWMRALLLSKLANILFVLELRKRLASTGVLAVALNPGGVDSPGLRSNVPAVVRLLMWPVLHTPWQGCQTTLYCALSSALEPASKDAPQPALYFDDCAPAVPRDTATDERVAALLWEASERYTGLAPRN